jgi:hypothetical protein
MLSHTGVIEEMLQPYFEKEIHILYQMSDGFVVCIESYSFHDAPSNIPVEDVLDDLEIDKEAFKSLK